MVTTVFAHVSARKTYFLVRLVVSGEPTPLWRRYRRADVSDEPEALERATQHLAALLGGHLGACEPVRVQVQCWGWLGMDTQKG